MALVGKDDAGAMPFSLSATGWGLSAASSEMATVPIRVPRAVGENTTAMVQLTPALSVAGHVLVWLKSAVEEIPAIFSPALPVLVNVMV